ncbi:hypothetical protein LCGC14_2881050 [marine sediment metagenome]|uniref:Uncharacterized protein n=1 Tax=marine sediment metagenome TaxID=412755 RepID=A0A0F9A818_9ZZZZ
MSCGKTACLDSIQHDSNSAEATSGYLQVEPDEFTREELQSIRGRARRLSIPGSPMKTVEERLYQQMADIADQLDAFAARFEAEVEDSNIVVFDGPTIDASGRVVVEPVVKSRHGDCHHLPFLVGGYRKS